MTRAVVTKTGLKTLGLHTSVTENSLFVLLLGLEFSHAIICIK